MDEQAETAGKSPKRIALKAVKVKPAYKQKTRKFPDDDYKYRCFRCPREFRTYRPLLVHMAFFHFRDILKTWKGSEENKCSFCNNKQFDSEDYLFAHFAKEHQALNSHIPKKCELEIKRPKPITPAANNIVAKTVPPISVPKIVKITGYHSKKPIPGQGQKVAKNYRKLSMRAKSRSRVVGELKSAEKCRFCAATYFVYGLKNHEIHCQSRVTSSPEGDIAHQTKNANSSVIKRQNGEKQTEFHCHLCKTTSPSAQFLLWHICWTHYSLEIASKFQVSKETDFCPLCGKLTKQYQHLIIHLAQMHFGLEGLVSQEVFVFLTQHTAITKHPKVPQTSSVIRIVKRKKYNEDNDPDYQGN